MSEVVNLFVVRSEKKEKIADLVDMYRCGMMSFMRLAELVGVNLVDLKLMFENQDKVLVQRLLTMRKDS